MAAAAGGALQLQHRSASSSDRTCARRPAPLLRAPARRAALLCPAPKAHQGNRSGEAALSYMRLQLSNSSATYPDSNTARLGLLALFKVIAASKQLAQGSASAATRVQAPVATTAEVDAAAAAAASCSFTPAADARAAQHAAPAAQLSTFPATAAAADGAHSTAGPAAATHSSFTIRAPQPQQPQLMADPAAAAALWAEELRHMQARRQHLAAEVADLMALRRQQRQQRHTTSSYEDAFVVDEGAEFCPLTCQVETSPELRQARQAVAQHVAALAPARQAWAQQQPNGGAAAAAHSSQQQPLPGVKQLQAQWEGASLEATHLLVRLAVLQQLPAQPKQRLTLRHAKEEALRFLQGRLASLACLYPQQQQQQYGAAPVALPSTVLPARLMPPQPSTWQVDAPQRAYAAPNRYWR